MTKPWLRKEWCIPAVTADFVAAMKGVPELYAEPPLPVRPGQPERYDYEYRRNSTCYLFVFFAPDAGWRHVSVTAQRTKLDFA